MNEIYALDPFQPCPDCEGAGGRSIGDCEDGIWENCDYCEGSGEDPYND